MRAIRWTARRALRLARWLLEAAALGALVYLAASYGAQHGALEVLDALSDHMLFEGA